MKKPLFLIVIPAFNEAERLPAYLELLLPGLVTYDKAEIKCLVVDDGSKPKHKEDLKRDIERRNFFYHGKISLLSLPENQGKGGAILSGWKENLVADYYTFLDADGAIPVHEVIRLVEQAVNQVEPCSIFGSRIVLLGKNVNRHWRRHYVGRLFAFLVGTFINPYVYDSQCGIKIIHASHWDRIRDYLTGHRFAFDIELLAALSAQDLPVREVPIDWQDVPGSKVSLWRDSFRMFCSILVINRKIKNGYYRKQENLSVRVPEPLVLPKQV